jgi:hypothetical protein
VYFYASRRDWESADAVLEPHENEPWGALASLRIALLKGDSERLAAAAKRMLTFAPSATIRLECGRALYRGGELERARETLLAVARDGAASDSTRAPAYNLLMRLVGSDLEDWDGAFALQKEWSEMRPSDPQPSAWAPTVANRRMAMRQRRSR